MSGKDSFLLLRCLDIDLPRPRAIKLAEKDLAFEDDRVGAMAKPINGSGTRGFVSKNKLTGVFAYVIFLT